MSKTNDIQWGGYLWGKTALAVVVFSGDHLCVPWTVGAHVRFHLEEGGVGFEDLPLEGDIPVGISIWEGTTKGGKYMPHSGDYEDTWLEGTFRSPTEEEWTAIKEGRCPWNNDDWMDPRTRE